MKSMDETSPGIVFAIDGQRFAVALSSVDRVVPACAFRRLRDAPYPMIGLLDLAGVIVPVLDVRTAGPRERVVGIDDLLLIVADGERRAAVLVDTVEGVEPIPANDLDSISGVRRGDGNPIAAWKRRGDLVLIHAIDSLLTGAVMHAVAVAVAESP